MPAARVLYIEDNLKQRQTFEPRLRKMGYSVTQAASGSAGLSLFQGREFDIVLCDLNMPGMSGVEVLEKIKLQDTEVPFILLTAHGSIGEAVSALKKGAYDFLSKPLEINRVQATIDKALEKKRLEKELASSQSSLQALIENLPDLIYSLNLKGEFMSVSPAAVKLLGYEVSEMLGTRVFKYMHPEDGAVLERRFAQAMEDRDNLVKTIEFRMISKSGDVKYFEVNRRIIIENGEAIRHDGIARDVTRRKLLELELVKNAAKLEERVAERTEKLEFANRQLAALNAASNRFSLIYSEDELFDEAPSWLCHSLEFDRTSILLEEKGALKMRSYCFHKDPPELINDFLRRVQDDTFKQPPHFMESFTQKKTIFVQNLQDDPRWPREPGQIIRTKAVVICPIKAAKKTIGVILGNMQHHERIMDQQDVARFEMFANMVGLALDNIRAYQSMGAKVLERTKEIRYANLQLRIKAKELQGQTDHLTKTNADLLAVQTQLEAKNAEMENLLQAFSESNNRLQAILDSSLNAILMFDRNDKVIAANKRNRDFFGLEVDGLTGKSITETSVMIKDCFSDFSVFEAHLSDPKRQHDPYREKEVRLVEPTRRILAFISVPVVDSQNRELGQIWSFADITARKAAEQAVKESEERFRVLFEEAPDAIFLAEPETGTILDANPAATKLLMRSREEIVGMSQTALHPHESPAQSMKEFRKYVAKINRSQDMRPTEHVVMKKDGGITPVEIVSQIVQINAKKVLLGTFRDITIRKRDELALRESEEKFRQLTENINEVFWLVELGNGKMIYVSPSYEDIFGRPAAMLYEKSDDWLNAVHPDDIQQLTIDMSDASRKQNEQVFRILRPDGGSRWIRSRAFPINDENGRIYRYCGVSEDITESKNAGEELRRERNFVSAILDTAGALVIVLSPEGKIVRFNRACELTTGYAFSDVEGKYVWDLFLIPSEIVRSRMEFGKMLAEDFPVYRERPWMTKEGSQKLIAWSYSALLANEEKLEFLIGTGIDITERKRMENALRKSLDELAESNQNLKETQAQLVQSEKMASLGMLVAGIAHEINTPIGAINSMHDTLKRAVVKLKDTLETELPGDYKGLRGLTKLLKIIENANKIIDSGSERVINIVRRLRSFARLDEAELKTADIHEGLDDTITLIQHEIKHNITLQKNYGKVDPIACFPGQLNQVFLNVLINAKQAIQDKGEITITTFQKNKRVHIHIRDNGVGIPEEKITKVFDPGFTTKGVGVGTGLGLSICYQIIQDHKGEIKVESEVGKGTTFKISLPMNLDELLAQAH